MGEGDFSSPVQQAQIPAEGLQQVKHLATCALQAGPEAGKQRQSFVSIKQQPQEPYVTFLDRLKNSLEKQVDNKQVRALVFQQVAIENANADCQKVLRTLQNPITEDMINACMNIGTHQHQITLAAQAFAVVSLNQQHLCYGCNQYGHICKNCPRERAKGNGTATVPQVLKEQSRGSRLPAKIR